MASADSSTDWLSSIDSLLSGGLSGQSSDPNLAISFDGYSLVQDGNAVANTGAEGNGNFDLAIAYGDDADANAPSLTPVVARAQTDLPDGGYYDGAYAGDADLIDNGNGGTGANDTAIDIGNNTNYEGYGGNSGAFAGAGGLIGETGNGNNDTAINFGNDSGFGDGPAAVDGNDNVASQSGDSTGDNVGSFAGNGNDNLASVVGADSSAGAGGGYGTDTTGNYDVATVFDPSGTDGSDANAGYDYLTNVGGSDDFATVLGVDHTVANAWGADYLYDVVTALGNESGTAAATGGGLLGELFSLF